MIRAKKHLGQHFLKDENIAKKIVAALSKNGYDKVLEIGAGTGVLTKYLLQEKKIHLFVVEIDDESIDFLKKNFPELKEKIIEGDFLKLNLENIFRDKFAIIGNFPYNISSQILFKVYEKRNQIPEVVGMFQKEVAERISAKSNSKKYGILSVLMQAFYDIEYLFTVNENVFSPAPKVKSGVICLRRNNFEKLNCDEELFKTVVKTAFNQRRKTLRNALSQKFEIRNFKFEILNKRAEQLLVNDFIELTRWIENVSGKKSNFNRPF